MFTSCVNLMVGMVSELDLKVRVMLKKDSNGATVDWNDGILVGVRFGSIVWKDDLEGDILGMVVGAIEGKALGLVMGTVVRVLALIGISE